MSTPFDVQEDPNTAHRRRQITNNQLADDEFLRSSLKTRAGRSYWWRFLERCHMFETSYIQGSFDGTAFREGERNIGQRLVLDITRVAPEAYLEMMKEHQKKTPIEESSDE